jgi:ubiquinone/menaquinone biosynthesis C-methylase UbiE
MTQTNPASNYPDEDEIIKSQMEKMVDSYDAYMKKVTFGREKVLRRATVNLAGIQPGDSVLEVGCGTGTLTLEAKEQAGASGRACGIDIIPGMIEASRRKAAAAHEEVTFQEGSIASIPFPENSFDVVLCSFMIFHMSEETRRKGIHEIQRVLKSGGRLMILDLTMPTQPIQKVIAKGLLGFSAGEDLCELLPLMEASGFSDLEHGPVKFKIFGLSVIGYVRGIALKV